MKTYDDIRNAVMEYSTSQGKPLTDFQFTAGEGFYTGEVTAQEVYDEIIKSMFSISIGDCEVLSSEEYFEQTTLRDFLDET